MYNIKALEEEWKKYNRKKKRPWYVLILIIIIVLLSMAAFFYMDNVPKFFSFKSIAKQKTEEKMKPSVVFVDKALTMLENKKSVIPVDAPMDLDAIPLEETKNNVSQAKKKLHIEVIEAGSSPTSYKEIAKRFRMGHDTDDSLFLAKSYYRKGNYKKAEYWALQTNKINGNIEESWLIFAKAKVKRGRRNEAIRILNAYIKRTRSIEAKVLLEKIKKGKI